MFLLHLLKSVLQSDDVSLTGSDTTGDRGILEGDRGSYFQFLALATLDRLVPYADVQGAIHVLFLGGSTHSHLILVIRW